MSAKPVSAHAQGRAGRNLRLGLILGSIALAVFVGVMLRYSVFQ